MSMVNFVKKMAFIKGNLNMKTYQMIWIKIKMAIELNEHQGYDSAGQLY